MSFQHYLSPQLSPCVLWKEKTNKQKCFHNSGIYTGCVPIRKLNIPFCFKCHSGSHNTETKGFPPIISTIIIGWIMFHSPLTKTIERRPYLTAAFSKLWSVEEPTNQKILAAYSLQQKCIWLVTSVSQRLKLSQWLVTSISQRLRLYQCRKKPVNIKTCEKRNWLKADTLWIMMKIFQIWLRMSFTDDNKWDQQN